MMKRIICGLLLSLFAVVPVTAATEVVSSDTNEVAWGGFGWGGGWGYRGYSPYRWGGYGYPYSYGYGYGYPYSYGYGFGGCSSCY